MKKTIKIAINILICVLIGGFVWYMIISLQKNKFIIEDAKIIEKSDFVSPYRLISTFDMNSTIRCFDFYDDSFYISTEDSIFVYNLSGTKTHCFVTGSNVRDIKVKEDQIYLLYPTKIERYSLAGELIKFWKTCSENSDYCSIALSTEYVYATDAENKNICQYTKEGNLVRFIKSPQGFVIPSHSFDIIYINDTLYCVNSGRHSIESYTLSGEFIASFGKADNEAGGFAGCCNPAYIAGTSNGDIITSEKGTPRISCYGKNGKFRTILFNSESLGGGNAAYKMTVYKDYIYIAGTKSISIYQFDPNIAGHSACAGCTANCPLREGVNQ